MVGRGEVGGKARGLLAAVDVLARDAGKGPAPGLRVSVPTFAVIGTEVFEAFLERNDLRRLALSDEDDRVVAAAFQRAELPVEIAGDLFALVREVRRPLAVRSSSRLEDALAHPFAGVFGTKMIPNSAPDPETRFRRLAEAVKFVYASTFSRGARSYLRALGREEGEERMAVVVQEVVGRRHGPRFYPEVSGVARSYNYYPTGGASPAEGMASLALGLGKTIVDGGRCWSYSPAWPRAGPPFGSAVQVVDETQREFWAVNMGPPAAYDPLAETEYLVRADLGVAEADGTLRLLASTYDPGSDRLTPGLSETGPRALTFAPLLVLDALPLNEAVRGLLARFAEQTGVPVEIEFALAEGAARGEPAWLAFLQVRPMLAPGEAVDLPADWRDDPGAVLAATRVVGNGAWDGLRDVVFVKRGSFSFADSSAAAEEIAALNRALLEEGRPYVLIGFGRFGSSDPWLGIPVAWGDVAGARVLVEASLPGRHVEPSQGAHFFHNLTSFGVPCFGLPAGAGRLDWEWLEAQPTARETPHLRHVRTPPLAVRVDGRTGRGLIRRTA
jgi:hypothetical protein